MRVPVLTAVSNALWEAELVAAFERGDLGVTVVRRCVDLADLLATASAGTARAALLSADLRRLDREALTRLAAAGVAVVGLVPPGDEAADLRLRQLGVRTVLPADAGPAVISAAVLAAVDGGGPGPAPTALADPRAALPDLPELPDLPRQSGAGSTTGRPGEDGDRPGGAARGRVVAVWGPTGAPGRTTVAVGVAAELAGLGCSTLLVDADVYGGVVAQVLGLLDESPGLAAACRAGNAGALDLAGLARLSRSVTPSLRLLSGIARADRWPELRPAALEVVLDLARDLAVLTVVDCGFGLEQDEELAYDTLAPRRNGATLTALAEADVVLAVGSADPVGLARLVRGLSELREALPGVAPRVVVNRVRSGAVPGRAGDAVRAALLRYAGVTEAVLVPHDLAALDAALASGRTLAETAPGSPARSVLLDLARDLAGVPAPSRAGRHRAGLFRRR